MAQRAYYHAQPELMPTHYSEGIIGIYGSRLADTHLWQIEFRGLSEYRVALARSRALIEDRATAESPYLWGWTSAQIRVIRHGRYTAPRFTPRAWRGPQRTTPAIIV